MKALTLLQPWAQLMVTRWESGRFCKMFETRSRRTSYRGPIAIHSSARHPKGIGDLVYRSPFKEALGVGKDPCDWYSREDYEEHLPTGVVLGIGRLVECITTDLAIRRKPERLRPFEHPQMTTEEKAFGDYSPGRFAWLIEDMVPMVKPVPAKGMLGLWEWQPNDEAREILRRFE